MKITVKKGQPLHLKRPTFLCDHVLKDNVPSPFHHLIEGFKFVVFCGRPGSGKTSFLFSLFKDKRCLRKAFNNVVVVMPQQSLNSIKKKDNIFKDISDEKFYTSLEDIDKIREQVKMYAEEGENSVIIIDDMMSSLKDSCIEKILCDIVANRRHYRCSIFLTSQIYERIPLKVRKLINILVVFFKPSKKEVNMLFDEQLEQKDDVADEIYKRAFNKQYDFLMIIPEKQKIYVNYDEILLTQD